MYISIRTKILGVLSALLVAAIFAYLVLADRIFREDKQLLVFDTNRANAERLASDFDISLRRVLDKSETLARLVLNDRATGAGELARDFFVRDPQLLLYQIVAREQDGTARLSRELIGEKHIRALKLDPESVRRLAAPTVTTQVTIENVSLPGSVLFLVRMPVEVAGGTQHLTVQIVVDGREWLESFQNENLSLSFALSSSGHLLAHPDTSLVSARADMRSNGLVRLAEQGRLPEGQVEFEAGGIPYLGVFQRGSLGGFTVFSMIGKKVALSASLLLLEKTIVLSLIVVTIVLLVGMWFARSLSLPLRRLVQAADEIAKGRFDSRISLRANASHDEIGELARAFDRMARDLKTSRVQLEDYSRSLEAKVQERTRELEAKNAAIREQQDVLLHTTRLAAVGEIAGQAAHEVLNPLTGMIARLEGMTRRARERFIESGGGGEILGLISDGWQKEIESGGLKALVHSFEKPSDVLKGSSLLEEDLANISAVREQLKDYATSLLSDLELLHSESFRISRIVDSMRGLSRHAPIRSRTNLADLLTEAVQTHEDLLARDDVVIQTRFDGPLFASVDRDEMRQVFANLLKNSRDAIAEKRARGGQSGVRGRISIAGTHDGGAIRITIRDNGIGVEPGDRDKIFEANFTTKGAEGTGFGLSICRRFVRAAGGELHIHDSIRGEFTEFEMVLPEAPDPLTQEGKA